MSCAVTFVKVTELSRDKYNNPAVSAFKFSITEFVSYTFVLIPYAKPPIPAIPFMKIEPKSLKEESEVESTKAPVAAT